MLNCYYCYIWELSVSIQTQRCVTLQFSNFAIAAVHFRVRICEYWHVSSWVYPSNWPLSTHWYWSTLSLSFAHTCVCMHSPTHTHNDAIIPLGMALSVAMVPLTAFSRSLVLSFAALTLPFSPATPAAFSTHTHTHKVNDDGGLIWSQGRLLMKSLPSPP